MSFLFLSFLRYVAAQVDYLQRYGSKCRVSFFLPQASSVTQPHRHYCQNVPSVEKISHAAYLVLSIFASEEAIYRNSRRMSQSIALSGVEVAAHLETSEKRSASLHKLQEA